MRVIESSLSPFVIDADIEVVSMEVPSRLLSDSFNVK